MAEDDRKLTVGVPVETYPGEARVALVPAVLPALAKAGCEVLLEAGAGERAWFPDHAYTDKGATLVTRAEAFAADVVVQVRTFGANPEQGQADLALMRPGQVVIGFTDALNFPVRAIEMANTGSSVFAVELMPRITRAQSMDVLSSQATVAGYKAVLVGAEALPKMFPMLTTAAGTIRPAKVFVIGAGVAGLQAIASARRLGAVVEAFDVRPVVKEQVQSVGGKFVEMEIYHEAATEDAGGYARDLGAEFLARQRELMTRVLSGTDLVITTAAIPGQPSPVLITAEMVKEMQPGSVIVDLAAERGGNCALTRPDETVHAGGVTIFGPTNLPATVPFHASSMYAKNVSTFLAHLAPGGRMAFDLDDQITRDTLLTRDRSVTQPRLLEALGLSE